MQSQKDAENLKKLNASVGTLSRLTAVDSKLLRSVTDQVEKAEVRFASLKLQLDEANKRLTRLSALIDETYSQEELKTKALTLLIDALEQIRQRQT